MTEVKLDLHMDNMYLVRYGEFLFATVNPTEIVAEVWGTQFINAVSYTHLTLPTNREV